MKGGLQGKKVTFRKYQGAKNIAVLVFPLCVCMLLVQLGIFHWNISMICWATLIFWLKYFNFLNEIFPFSPILKAAIIAVLVFPFDWVWILWVQLGIFYWNISEEEFDSGFAAGLRDNRWWGWFWKRIWKKFEKIWNIYMYIWHLIEKQLVLLRICERNVSTSADGKSSFGIFLERWNILIEKVTKLKRGKIEGHDTKKCSSSFSLPFYFLSKDWRIFWTDLVENIIFYTDWLAFVLRYLEGKAILKCIVLEKSLSQKDFSTTSSKTFDNTQDFSWTWRNAQFFSFM